MPKMGGVVVGLYPDQREKRKARCAKSIDIPCLLCSANKCAQALSFFLRQHTQCPQDI